MTKHIETLPNGFSFEMLLIPGGSFNMGSTNADKIAYDCEKPKRIDVQITPFYLALYVVTQSLWKAVMGEESDPSYYKGDQHPVENVSWLDIQGFIDKLNEQTKGNRDSLKLGVYRLPTEAEWEYAARGCPYTGTYRYAGSDKLKEVGWFGFNSDNETHEVGLLMSNQLGLFDMSGNIWEWVEDHWHDNYIGAPEDGRAWLTHVASANRVVRGGSSFSGPLFCRVGYRKDYAPADRLNDLGFRLALSPA